MKESGNGKTGKGNVLETLVLIYIVSVLLAIVLPDE